LISTGKVLSADKKGYQYHFTIDDIGSRSDVKNKKVNR